jgi:hypothetical protein
MQTFTASKTLAEDKMPEQQFEKSGSRVSTNITMR